MERLRCVEGKRYDSDQFFGNKPQTEYDFTYNYMIAADALSFFSDCENLYFAIESMVRGHRTREVSLIRALCDASVQNIDSRYHHSSNIFLKYTDYANSEIMYYEHCTTLLGPMMGLLGVNFYAARTELCMGVVIRNGRICSPQKAENIEQKLHYLSSTQLRR